MSQPNQLSSFESMKQPSDLKQEVVRRYQEVLAAPPLADEAMHEGYPEARLRVIRTISMRGVIPTLPEEHAHHPSDGEEQAPSYEPLYEDLPLEPNPRADTYSGNVAPNYPRVGDSAPIVPPIQPAGSVSAAPPANVIQLHATHGANEAEARNMIDEIFEEKHQIAAPVTQPDGDVAGGGLDRAA